MIDKSFRSKVLVNDGEVVDINCMENVAIRFCSNQYFIFESAVKRTKMQIRFIYQCSANVENGHCHDGSGRKEFSRG